MDPDRGRQLTCYLSQQDNKITLPDGHLLSSSTEVVFCMIAVLARFLILFSLMRLGFAILFVQDLYTSPVLSITFYDVKDAGHEV